MLTGIETGLIQNGQKRVVGKLKQVLRDKKEGRYRFLFENGSVLLIRENTLFYHTLLRYEDDRVFLEFTSREYLFSLLAYSLYETYGLPLEFTVDEAMEFGIPVDEAGFEYLKELGRSRSHETFNNKDAFSTLRGG